MKAATGWHIVSVIALAWFCTSMWAGPVALGDETDDLIAKILEDTRSRPEAAQKVLEMAVLLSDAPQVQARLAEKAYEFGMASPLGYKTALGALDLLEKVVPQKASTWRENRMEVYHQQYLRGLRSERLVNARKYVDALVELAGQCAKKTQWPTAAEYYRQAYNVARAVGLPDKEAISMSLRSADAWAAVESRVSALKETIRKNPADLASRNRLIDTYLIDLDRPSEAAKYVNESVDESMRTHLALAVKDAAELADVDFVTLGTWYRTLSAKAVLADAKIRLLTRARDNLRMFLEVYSKKDLKRLNAVAQLKGIEADLAVISKTATISSAPQWLDMLAMVDPAKHKAKGTIQRTGRELICSDSSYALASVPITAVGDYDLQVAFTIKDGYQSTVILPVGLAQTALVLRAQPGSMCGLEMVNGQPLTTSNPAAVRPTDYRTPFITVGARNTLDVAVRTKGVLAEVTVTLNRKKLFAWSGAQKSLSLYDHYWSLPAKTFGLGGSRSTVVYHTARLRRLDPADRALNWVSRDASYRISSSYSTSYPPKATFLTGEGTLHSRGMSFRTGSTPTPPWVVVTLKQSERIKRIILDNARGSYARDGVGLVVELSSDGRKWTPTWRSTEARPSWVIELKAPTYARYIRITRDNAAATSSYNRYICLAGIRVYAWPR